MITVFYKIVAGGLETLADPERSDRGEHSSEVQRFLFFLPYLRQKREIPEMISRSAIIGKCK